MTDVASINRQVPHLVGNPLRQSLQALQTMHSQSSWGALLSEPARKQRSPRSTGQLPGSKKGTHEGSWTTPSLPAPSSHAALRHPTARRHAHTD